MTQTGTLVGQWLGDLTPVIIIVVALPMFFLVVSLVMHAIANRKVKE